MERARIEELIEAPLYFVADVAYLIGTTASAITRWISPYPERRFYGPPRTREPLIIPPEPLPDGRVLSFINLLEADLIHRYRQEGVSLADIRRAVQYARDELNDRHPLRTRRFETDGKRLFAILEEKEGVSGLIVAAHGQIAWPEAVERFFRSVEYDEVTNFAERWWPLGPTKPILVDPRLAFGRPVVRDEFIRTDILVERFLAGEATREIADDFELSADVVEEAIRFETLRKAA